MNLAKLLEGPATIEHRGVFIDTRGGSVLTPTAEAFAIESDADGAIDQRHAESTIQLALTPIGVWTQEVLDVLYRWRTAQPGQLITPRYDVDSVSAAADTLTLVGTAAPRLGAPVVVSSWGTLPGGLAEATIYYLGIPDPEGAPTTVSLHDTAAHAIAGTNKTAISDAGTGDHAILEQEPLTIHTHYNRRIDFWNAAVVGMPPILFSALQSLIGAVNFEAFCRNGVALTDAHAFYTVTKEVFARTPPVPAQIPTQEYSFAWGAAPWDAFKMRGGFTLAPTLGLRKVDGASNETVSRMITAVGATGRGAPLGFTEQQLLDILGLQGAGAAIGATKVRGDLTIAGTGVFGTLYNAAPRALPQTFSANNPRAGELDFVSARTPGAPAFYLGVAEDS